MYVNFLIKLQHDIYYLKECSYVRYSIVNVVYTYILLYS